MNKFLNKFDLIVIGLSIIATTGVATVCGIIGPSIAGNFLSWFSLSILIQVVCFFAINTFIAQRERISQEMIQLEALDKLANFTLQLSCAYCQQPNTTIVQLNQKNTFKCESCNQTNGVYMQFTATTLTTPVGLAGSTFEKQAE
jgi:hypothetical protein